MSILFPKQPIVSDVNDSSSDGEGSDYSTEYEFEELVPVLASQSRRGKRCGEKMKVERGRRFQSKPTRVNGCGRGRRSNVNNHDNVDATESERSSPLNDDPLDKPEDAQNRREIYKEIYRLVHGIRREKSQTTSKYANYQWPPLLLQVIRCRYPSGVKNYENHREPDVVFTDESFVDLFK